MLFEPIPATKGEERFRNEVLATKIAVFTIELFFRFGCRALTWQCDDFALQKQAFITPVQNQNVIFASSIVNDWLWRVQNLIRDFAKNPLSRAAQD